MRRNKTRHNVKQKIASSLAIPEDILCDVPHFTLSDNKELQIENYKGILSYDESEIALKAKGYKIVITGSGLKITVITDEYIVINGTISALSFT